MKRLFQKNSGRLEVDADNPYWVSFSDIMAGLLAVFILALIALIIRLDRQTSMTIELRKEGEIALEE
ncbi:MAG: hypothetical protein KAR13_05030, partial [Desulfobulbaceae bacterium]|nr:hypothetical protein [Desulfobulbaceae bacterium]